MFVTKCDLCKKEVKNDAIIAGVGYKRFELCDKCGSPIKRFLKKRKLMEDKKNK